MATKHKCDICGAPATVHITKIIDNNKMQIHMCAECAKKNSLNAMAIPPELLPNLQKLEATIAQKSENKAQSCPNCGTSFDDSKKNPIRFACAYCYVNMPKKNLDSLLSHIQPNLKHIGKVAKNTIKDKAKVESLNLENLELDPALIDAITQSIDDIVKTNTQQKPKEAKQSKQSLEKALNQAIDDERYEDAAILRDQLKDFEV